jgi:hypothetical protein
MMALMTIDELRLIFRTLAENKNQDQTFLYAFLTRYRNPLS